MAGLIAKRYGSAIFELAVEKDAVALLKKEVFGIRESFLEDDLIDILSHPKISVEQKIALLENALSDNVSKDLLGLLVLIVKKGRQHYISDILEEVIELTNEYEGKVKAYITSSNPLSDEHQSRIIKELAKQTNKEIIPVYEIDPSIIGGLVIRIGDRIVDNSIKGHLHGLSRELLETRINIS